MNGTIIGLIGTALSLITSLVALTVVITQMRSNLAVLNQREEQLTTKNAKTFQDITDLLILVKTFIAEQTEVNRHVSATLQSMVNKLDDTERRAVESKAVVDLVQEIMRRNKPVNIE